MKTIDRSGVEHNSLNEWNDRECKRQAYVHPDGTRSTEPPPRMANGRGMTANEYRKHKASNGK